MKFEVVVRGIFYLEAIVEAESGAEACQKLWNDDDLLNYVTDNEYLSGEATQIPLAMEDKCDADIS